MAIDSKRKRTAGRGIRRSNEFEYTVVFQPDYDEGGWVASVPALGIATQGETLAEARKMVRQAISGLIQGLRDEGIAIPAEQRSLLRRIRTERIAVRA